MSDYQEWEANAALNGDFGDNDDDEQYVYDEPNTRTDDPDEDPCAKSGHDYRTVTIAGEECSECRRCGAIDA